MQSHLDGTHERVVAVVEELKTEVPQIKSDAQRRPPRDVRIHDRPTVFWPLAGRLVAIELYVVDGLQTVVVDEIPVGNGLDVRNDKRTTKRRVPKIIKCD